MADQGDPGSQSQKRLKCEFCITIVRYRFMGSLFVSPRGAGGLNITPPVFSR